MSLLYPADAIPEAARCPDCDGSGDEWAVVGTDPSGAPFMEPIGECPACQGTGYGPLDDCPECQGEGGEFIEVDCCRGSIWTIECACGGRPLLEQVSVCGACDGEGKVTGARLAAYLRSVAA